MTPALEPRAPRRRPALVAWGSVVTPLAPEPDIPARHEHRELDAQRGAAVIAIVVFHVYQFCNVAHFLYFGTAAYTVLNSLDAAVPWLFVITAFLLFEPIARAVLEEREPQSLRSFLAHRAIRLLPVYYVSVLVVWLLRQPSLPGDWRDLFEHLTFTQVFDAKRIFYTIGPAWAVSVAVIFYLLLGALSIGASHLGRRLSGRRPRIVMLSGAIAVLATVSLAWKAWAFAVDARPTGGSFTTWFGPLANLDNFALGMAVALLVVVLGSRPLLTARDRLGLRIAATTILVVAFVIRQPDSWSAVYFSTICSVAFAGLVAAAALAAPDQLRAPDNRPRIMKAAGRALAGLGTISLSVYLWHEPIMLGLRWHGLVRQAPAAFDRDVLVVVIASLALGWLSYRAIERPARQLSELLARAGRTPQHLPSP